MITLINSLLVSNIILNVLLNDKEVHKFDGYVETFSNCREQGYKLVTNSFKNNVLKELTICFSENRNSDSIVVYYSNQYEGVRYSDKFWNSRKLFKYNEFYEVIEYIKELLISEL